MDKSTVQNLIIAKNNRLSLIENNGASPVWKFFLVIYVDGQCSGFAMCKTCKSALRWRSCDGTSGLKSHAAICSGQKYTAVTRSIKDFLHKENPKKKYSRTLPTAVKAKVTDAVALMCAMDILPFSLVEGIGFARLADLLISIGAKYGQVSSDLVLPSARTVSRHISAIAEKEKAALSEVLGRQNKFAITTDLWTEDGTGMAYITVTAHYVDDNFHLHARVLATRTLLDKHTAANIRSTVKEILEKFGAYRQNNVYITDNGANVKAAFKDQQWLSCAGHNLNLVLVHGLKHNDNFDSPIADVSVLINLAKDTVAHVKHSKMHHKLETSLKQAVPTRWNSIYNMLESVSQNLPHLKELANEYRDKKLQRLLLDLNEALLNDTICVLRNFDAATTALSADKTPTLCNVLPTRAQLFKHLSVTAADSSIIASIKKHFEQLINTYFPVYPLHSIASLLHPCLKNNPVIFPEDAKTQAIISLKRLYDEVEMEAPSTSNLDQHSTLPEIATVGELPGPGPSKRRKTDATVGFLSDFFEAAVNEVDSYLCSTDVDADVLRFWRTKQESWPKLAKVARGILCIPATSTSSERVFSIAEKTVVWKKGELD